MAILESLFRAIGHRACRSDFFNSIDRQPTSRLVALSEDSGILGYSQSDDPRRFLRELLSGHRPHQPVRIYEVCPPGTEDLGHYYDFEAQCLLSRNPHVETH